MMPLMLQRYAIVCGDWARVLMCLCAQNVPKGPSLTSSWFSKIARMKVVRSLVRRITPNAFTAEDKDRIKQFWLSPLISRVSPNKTVVVKRRSAHNEVADVVSLYYRQHSVGEAYKMFKERYPDIKCSRSSFHKYKPLNVKKPQSKQDCCPICKESRRYLPHLLGHRDNLDTNDRRALAGFLEHKRLVAARSDDYERQLERLAEGTALITMDFKANITLGGGAEEDSHVFFSAPQRTVFGLVAYFKLGGEIYKVFFTIVSPVIMHDTKTVVEILDTCVLGHPIFEHFKCKNLSFWMDNAPGHFRTKEMIAGFYDLEKSTGMNVEFNYFPEYHGKSECDRHFGLISRIYTEHKSKAINPDITTTDEYLNMYKGAIRRFGGNVIPTVGGNYDELLPESGTKLNVIAQEFSYEGAEALMSGNDSDAQKAGLPLPYIQRVVKAGPRFKFNYFYSFKFSSSGGKPTLRARQHCSSRRMNGDDPQDPSDLEIPLQSWKTFPITLENVRKDDYHANLGVLTSVRPKYSSLSRTLFRISFHETA